MTIKTLEHEKARAMYDEELKIAFIQYNGDLDAAASAAVYDWLGEVTQTVGLENLHGEIFDFREVTDFMPDNLMEARKKSRRMNLRNDVQNLPVAMIVKDFYQEEILRGPMQNVKENPRKTIVSTMDDALAFIASWHGRADE